MIDEESDFAMSNLKLMSEVALQRKYALHTLFGSTPYGTAAESPSAICHTIFWLC